MVFPRTSGRSQGALVPLSCGWLLSDKLNLVEAAGAGGKQKNLLVGNQRESFLAISLGTLGLFVCLGWEASRKMANSVILPGLNRKCLNGTDSFSPSLMGTGLGCHWTALGRLPSHRCRIQDLPTGWEPS